MNKIIKMFAAPINLFRFGRHCLSPGFDQPHPAHIVSRMCRAQAQVLSVVEMSISTRIGCNSKRVYTRLIKLNLNAFAFL